MRARNFKYTILSAITLPMQSLVDQEATFIQSRLKFGLVSVNGQLPVLTLTILFPGLGPEHLKAQHM